MLSLSKRKLAGSGACRAGLLSFSVATVALLSIGAAMAAGPAPVNLRSASRLTILSEAGITDVPTSTVIGNVGTSPITGAADLLSCAEVTGYVFSVDAAGPQPCALVYPSGLTKAVGDMTSAYTDAAGRAADFTNIGNGDIGGYTLPPGVYKWSTGVTIPTSVTLQGSKTDVWIFQIAQGVDIAAGKRVLLSGGASSKNIYWQIAGATTIEPNAHFEGNILDATSIAMQTGATICGRLLSQTAVTLQSNYVMAY